MTSTSREGGRRRGGSFFQPGEDKNEESRDCCDGKEQPPVSVCVRLYLCALEMFLVHVCVCVCCIVYRLGCVLLVAFQLHLKSWCSFLCSFCEETTRSRVLCCLFVCVRPPTVNLCHLIVNSEQVSRLSDLLMVPGAWYVCCL